MRAPRNASAKADPTTTTLFPRLHFSISQSPSFRNCVGFENRRWPIRDNVPRVSGGNDSRPTQQAVSARRTSRRFTMKKGITITAARRAFGFFTRHARVQFLGLATMLSVVTLPAWAAANEQSAPTDLPEDLPAPPATEPAQAIDEQRRPWMTRFPLTRSACISRTSSSRSSTPPIRSPRPRRPTTPTW